MEYILVYRGKDQNGNLITKVIGRYTDKEQAKTKGEQLAQSLVYKHESVVMVSGNVSDDGQISGQYRLYERWS